VRSSGLKKILIEPKRIYKCTQIQTGAITPVDYNLLARGIDINDEHSAIAESQSSNSYKEKGAFTNMANNSEEMAKRFEEQSWVQREQQDMLRVQQESSNDLKKMIALLLDKKKSKGSKTRASSSKSKRKQKEDESSPSEKTKNDDNSNFEPPKSSSEEEGNSKNGDNHFRRMNELEKGLGTIANRCNL